MFLKDLTSEAGDLLSIEGQHTADENVKDHTKALEIGKNDVK